MKQQPRLAACSIEIKDAGPRVQLFPAGEFRAVDGRPTDAPFWFLDATLANALIAAADARQTPYCFDYEHQSLNTQKNGQPAPAAGWFKTLEWVEGIGLFATDVEWTDAAKSMIEAKEYRFISPLFTYGKDGAVRRLINSALTNTPALDGMDEILAAASQNFEFEGEPVDEILEQLRWMLNLPLSANADDVKAELEKLIAKLTNGQGTAAASIDLVTFVTSDAQKDEQIAALSAQVQTLTTQSPDPSKFVPLATVEQLQTQMAALTAQINGGQVDGLITAALSDGRLNPAMEDWARDLGKKDLSYLKTYLDKAQPIAALNGLQTNNAPNRPQQREELDADSLAICNAFGNDPKDIAKALNGQGE